MLVNFTTTSATLPASDSLISVTSMLSIVDPAASLFSNSLLCSGDIVYLLPKARDSSIAVLNLVVLTPPSSTTVSTCACASGLFATSVSTWVSPSGVTCPVVSPSPTAWLSPGDSCTSTSAVLDSWTASFLFTKLIIFPLASTWSTTLPSASRVRVKGKLLPVPSFIL